jgi:GNAT superfamily N-acetyltransferase
MTEFEIRELTSNDVDGVGNMAWAGGFGDRRELFRMAIEMTDCRPILAVSEDRPIGTGLGAIHGDVGWVGMIFVEPELRGRGIGRALTVAVCDILQDAGCRSLVLVATDMGRPVYDRLGFREQTRYHMHPADPLDAAPVPPPGASLRQIRTSDIDAIAVLDRCVSGEDRRPLIKRFAASGWLLEDGPGAGSAAGTAEPSLRGYLLPTYRGNAALIAPRHEDALCLLDLRRHLVPQGGTAWAGLVTENEAGRRLLAERGRAEWRTFPRMVRGPEPEWRPEAIWGQFNHAMG